MDYLRQLLTNAASALTRGKLATTGSAPVGGTLDRLFLGHPGSVLEVLFFKDAELKYQKMYDPRAGRVITDPDISGRQLQAVHGVLDFMRDTFPGHGGDTISYQVGKWWIIGLRKGAYTLVAMTRASEDPETVERWLEDLAQQIPTLAEV